MRGRGLGDPLLVVSDGAPGIIRAIEECFPRSARQRCLAHRMRNLAVKVPTDLWPEFKARASACYQAPSRAIARDLAKGIRADYGTLLPSAVACFEDDFEACIAHLRLPVTHRRSTRTTNLLERLFGEERRRLKITRTASARSRCSSSCSAPLCVRRSAGAACASLSSSFVRSPPSERTSTPSTRQPDQTGRPRHAFPADPRLDRRSSVARASIDLFRPAKRGGNGRIVPKGAPEIPSDVVASFPDDVMLAELEESTEIERFDDAVLEIRATDRDAAQRGWAGRLKSGSVKTKRLPLKLYPTVDRDSLATRDKVRVEAIVESRPGDDELRKPLRIHVLRMLD